MSKILGSLAVDKRKGASPRSRLFLSNRLISSVLMGITAGIPEDLQVGSLVVPTVDLSKFMGVRKHYTSTLTAQGNGAHVLHTVPKDKFWIIEALSMDMVNITCDYVRITDSAILTNSTDFPLAAGGESNVVGAIGVGIGYPDTLTVGLSNDAGADVCYSYLYVREFDL